MRCPDCGEEKALEDFPRNRASKTGRQTYCKPCYNARMRFYKERQHGSQRNFLLKHRYGIDEETFRSMQTSQGYLCAICRRSPARHVDHCHETGVVRGLLCFNCNGALGRFQDDVSRLRAAMVYLQAHG